jgi:hypothetical protein
MSCVLSGQQDTISSWEGINVCRIGGVSAKTPHVESVQISNVGNTRDTGMLASYPNPLKIGSLRPTDADLFVDVTRRRCCKPLNQGGKSSTLNGF